MELVLFDIHAKQRFIFSSTRLKENVGASFQITLLDSWVEESIAKLNRQCPVGVALIWKDSAHT